MNDPLYHKLREAGWRRKLASAEQAELRAWLASHPEAQTDWEAELRLTQTLRRLPDAPVPSNFTARVLAAVEREDAGARRKRPTGWKWAWRSLLPRVALAAVVLGVGWFAYHESRAAKRLELAQSVAAVADVRSLPSPEILQDFEAIRQLNPTPAPDEELLALLK
jgi:anti-sigma factor RsiW